MKIAGIQVQGAGNVTYMVDVNPEGALRCSCPDYFYRGAERPCKHITFAAEFIKLPELATT